MNAASYAEMAARLTQAGAQLKSDNPGPYAEAKELARYHLLSAARKLRDIAEALAGEERGQAGSAQ